MARKVLVALALFCLLGLAFAEAANAPNEAPNTKDAGSAAPGPSDDVGNDDGSSGSDAAASAGFAQAGPVGGPVPAGVFANSPTDSSGADEMPAKKNGGSTLEVSAFAGVAATAVAGFSFFYF